MKPKNKKMHHAAMLVSFERQRTPYRHAHSEQNNEQRRGIFYAEAPK
jgi:hypothetical protein